MKLRSMTISKVTIKPSNMLSDSEMVVKHHLYEEDVLQRGAWGYMHKTGKKAEKHGVTVYVSHETYKRYSDMSRGCRSKFLTLAKIMFFQKNYSTSMPFYVLCELASRGTTKEEFTKVLPAIPVL